MVSRSLKGYAITATLAGQEFHLHGDTVISDLWVSAPYPPWSCETVVSGKRIAPAACCSALNRPARPKSLVHPRLDPRVLPRGCEYMILVRLPLPFGAASSLQRGSDLRHYAEGMRSMTRMIAIVLPLFSFASAIPFLQDHTSPVFATN
jgi:hypothetical protein